MSKRNAIIRLRRDNDYNYAKIKDKFIPANGEICLVDTAREGLKVVCGDGKTTFGNLEYIGEVLVRGYYSNTKFYEDKEFSKEIQGNTTKIYIDLTTGRIFYYDGNIFQSATEGGALPTASASVAGVMKLYDSVGQNTDGTMTQKAISDELDDKIEATVISEDELLVFSSDL